MFLFLGGTASRTCIVKYVDVRMAEEVDVSLHFINYCSFLK